MEKRIKDYLHFYLGCTCYAEFADGSSGSFKLTPLHLLDDCFDVSEEETSLDPTVFKPILRPISDMTEDESIAADKIHLSAHYSNTPNITTVAEYTRFLLSKHFDLFGLIEAGLAIQSAPVAQ